MQLRIERKKDDKVVLQVLAAPGVSDGDLAVLLENSAMDLRFDVVEDSEPTVWIGEEECRSMFVTAFETLLARDPEKAERLLDELIEDAGPV